MAEHLDAILEQQALPLLMQAGERAMLARLRSGNITRHDIEFYVSTNGGLKKPRKKQYSSEELPKGIYFIPTLSAKIQNCFLIIEERNNQLKINN